MANDAYQKYGKPLREWYIKHGICPVCGQREASRGRQTCLLCKNDMDARVRICYKKRTPEQKERYKQTQKECREKYVSQGLCYNCGQRPVAEGRKRCMICLQKDRKRHKQKYMQAGHIPQELRGNGVYCYRCCRPLCNGEKLCTECREQATANLHNERQRDNSNHIWRKWEAVRIAEVKIKHGWIS